MYSVKPVSQSFEIHPPKCMYNIPSLHKNIKDEPESKNIMTNKKATTTCNFTELNEKILNLINSSIKGVGINSLESRQQKLLLQLDEFKNQLQEIREKLNITTSSKLSCTSMSSSDFVSSIGSDNIVVNVHPKFIPYGLLGLKNLWQNCCNLSINCYAHSTLPGEIGAAAEHFQKQVTINKKKNILPTISLTLIWKDCENTEMICCQTKYKPIYGEVNLLRYLSRIGPKQHVYDFKSNANSVDAILDICYQLLRGSGGSNHELLKVLSERLGKQSFFGGYEISIADIALGSSIKRCSQISEKNLPENLKKWQLNVKTIFQI